MPQFDGFAALRILQELELDTPFILVSGMISQQTAIEIMTAGAQDYLDKNDMTRLIPVVKRELKQAAIRHERKQAEIALRNSEEQYRTLINVLPSGVVVHNGGVIQMINNAGAKLLGTEDPQQLTGINLMERVHPDCRALVRAQIATSMNTGNHAPLLEEKLMRLDDTCFDAEVAGIPITYADKPSMLVIFNDVTERKKAEEELRKHLAELEAIHTVSKTLRAAQTIEDVLPLLLDQTLVALEADTGVIWMRRPAQNDLRVVVGRGWFGDMQEPPIKPGQGIAGTVFETEKAHVAKEFTKDPLIYCAPGLTIPEGWGGVCAPILSNEQMIGVIFISVRLPREITPDEVKLLSSLTEMTGAALHRMRLHEETVQRLKNLQAIHEIDQAMTASFDLTMIFDIILTHITSYPKLDASAILLFRPYQNILEYAATRGFKNKISRSAGIALTESPAGRAILERHNILLPDINASPEKKQLSALWAGESFYAYIGIPLIVKGEVKGMLEVFTRKPFTPTAEETEFLNTVAGQAAIAVADIQLFNNLQHANQELSIAYDATIEGWSHALDLRDKETEGHTQRVTEIATKLAVKMEMPESELLHFRRGAILHDIGKMGVPDHILLKPGKLTPKERETIKQHPQFAYEMLRPIKYLQRALDIPYSHHERWDGTGYPRGLKGEQIPLAARIFAVVDVWDALTSKRPYRKAWDKDKTRKYILEESGKHFDPAVVEVFVKMLDEIE
jgi:PAS domain S-box-containing protein/putative nucleotidyltransferase with HDIG domain